MYTFEIDSASKIEDFDQRRLALAHAEADVRKAAAEAIIEHENQILQIQEKQKAQFEDFIKGGFDAILTGKSRGLNDFVKSQVFNLGTNIVGNSAGMLYSAVGGNPFQVPGQGTSANSTVLGSLLKGVGPFGIDPLKEAKTQDTTALATAIGLDNDATKVNTDALTQLTNAILYFNSKGQVGSIPGGVAIDNLGPSYPGLGESLGIPGNISSPDAVLATPAITAAAAAIAGGVVSNNGTVLAAKALSASGGLAGLLGNIGVPTGQSYQPVGPTQSGGLMTPQAVTIPLSSLLGPAVATGAGALGLIQGLGEGGPKAI